MAASVQDLLLAARAKGQAQQQSPIADLLSSFLGGVQQNLPTGPDLRAMEKEKRELEAQREKQRLGDQTKARLRKAGEHIEEVSVGPKGGQTFKFTPRKAGNFVSFVDKITGQEIRREATTGPSKVVKIGGDKPTDAKGLLQDTYSNASRTGFFTDVYFDSFNALADAANIPNEQRPTRENPTPPGLLETIFEIQSGDITPSGGIPSVTVTFEELQLPDEPKFRNWFDRLTPEQKVEAKRQYGR